MKIEINNAHIVDPANAINKVANLYIHNKTIAAIGDKPKDWQADEIIDAKDRYLFPGLIDIATRLREPGQEHKATIASETYAAVSGGITSVVCLPDTEPAINSPAEVELIQQRTNATGHCHVYVIGALTSQLKGSMLSEMAALKEAGVVGVSNVLHPMANNLVLRRAMEYASSQDLTLFYHPMDHDLATNGCIHEGMSATRMGLTGIPTAAETAAVGSCLALIEQTGVRVHFCRLSTQRSLQMLERAKFDGAPISADISAHQLFLSDMDIVDFDGNYHMLPPLRGKTDVAGLRRKLHSEILVGLCSDHQPHEHDAKLAPFASTEPGISALETLLPLTLQLVKDEVASLVDVISLLTNKPAKLLNINAGSLTPGHKADLCICDPAIEWKLNPQTMHSQGKNTPFLNKTFKGKVTHTFVDGKLVFKTQS
ncbi:MAG: dihydroorotase [Gammaproteobacteria bacterium]|nr:dihydroorotase [Gammaproteobacteria bacterium]